MNATFGNYSPAQYAYQDNTLSSIGNRFANAAASIPGLIREGEKWQDERNARQRAQQERDNDAAQRAELAQRMQWFDAEIEKNFGQRVFNHIDPGKYNNIQDLTLAYGNALNGVMASMPEVVQGKFLQMAVEFGKQAEAQKAMEHSAFNASKNGQGQNGGVGIMGVTLPQNLGQEPQGEPNRIEQSVHPDDGLGETNEEWYAKRYGEYTGATNANMDAARMYASMPQNQEMANQFAEMANQGSPYANQATPAPETAPQSAPSDYSPLIPQAGQTATAGGQVPVGGQGVDRFMTPERKAAIAEFDTMIDGQKRYIESLRANNGINSKPVHDAEDRLRKLIHDRDALYPKSDPYAARNQEMKEEAHKAKLKKDEDMAMAALIRANKNPNPPNLYSPMQTGNEQAQNNYEQAYGRVIDLQKQLRDAGDKEFDTVDIEKNLKTANDNLTIAGNALRNAAQQTAYLGETDKNIKGYSDNVANPKVADLNRSLAAGVVAQLPLKQNGHGQLTLNGTPLFSSRELNPVHNNTLGKMLDDLTRGHNIGDNDKIQIITEVIETLRKQNIQLLKEKAANSGVKKR